MFNKNVKIYCNEKDMNTIKEIISIYVDRKNVNDSKIYNTVCLEFECSMFDIKNVERDMKVINLVGIEAEMHIR